MEVMKGWNSKEFNGSERTDSSLLITQHIVICLHTKAFPMTACAGATAPHSWDNPRKFTSSTGSCLLHCMELSSSTTARNMDCLAQEEVFQTRWFSDCVYKFLKLSSNHFKEFHHGISCNFTIISCKFLFSWVIWNICMPKHSANNTPMSK